MPRREHTSKALKYGTCSQGISRFYLHTPHTSANKMHHKAYLLFPIKRYINSYVYFFIKGRKQEERLEMEWPALQGCGLGLDVSLSRRSRDVPTSRLGLVSRKIVSVSVSSRSREADVSVSSRSRPFTSRAQDQCINNFLVGMQMAPYTV